MKKLTPAQSQLYGWIANFIQEHRYAPTIREMMRGVGLKSPSAIQARLNCLRAAGAVSWVEHKPRTLVLLIDS